MLLIMCNCLCITSPCP